MKYFPAVFKPQICLLWDSNGAMVMIPVGRRYRGACWNTFRLQLPSPSIVLLPEVSFWVLPTTIAHTHGFNSSAVYGPPCLLCRRLSSFLERKIDMVVSDSSWTPKGLFSVTQTHPCGSPQKRGQHCFFTPATCRVIAAACQSFCIYNAEYNPLWIF